MGHAYKVKSNWTRTDEIRQRIGNCRRFLTWAWMSLTTDSTLLAVVFVNMARETGDEAIASIKRKGVKIQLDATNGANEDGRI